METIKRQATNHGGGCVNIVVRVGEQCSLRTITGINRRLTDVGCTFNVNDRFYQPKCWTISIVIWVQKMMQFEYDVFVTGKMGTL